MAENDFPINKGSMGEVPTMDPRTSHGGRRFVTGDVILGRYVVESELGQGGMGVVYKCLDQVGGVKVAVKGLPPDVAHNEGEMEEIRANFQLVCDLRHENIAGVRTLEKDDTGDYYLVMDLAHGTDLGSWMRKNKDADLKVRLSIVRQIASALDYAHRRKVMHRDIKPGNIMVSPSGRVLLLDFGLAAQISTSLSRTSHMVVSQSGTPAYKSPEQWRGRPQGAEADQYALAVVAYRLLSGKLPFDGDNVLVLCRAVLEEKPPAIKWLPAYANKAFARALAKDPHDRFPSCTAFADALEGKSAAGGFWRPLLVILLSAGVLLTAGGFWLRFEKKKDTAAPLPLPSKTDGVPPVVVDPPSETNTPPPVVVDPPSETNTPPPVVVDPPPETDTPPPVVVDSPSETDTPPPVVVDPPSETNTPSPVVDPPPQPPIDQKKADWARLDAEKAQEKAKNAWVDVQNDIYQAACRRLEEAEDLYKKGDYKQATFKFYQAVEQFSAMNGQTPTSDVAPADDMPTGGTTAEVKMAIGEQMSEVTSPSPQPTIAQRDADRARLDAMDAQKKARNVWVDVQNDAYQAACRRLEEAEDLYKKGDYKQAVFKFYQAVDQFSAANGKKE